MRETLSALRGDTGLILILAIQMAVIFVVAPLATTGSVPVGMIEVLRFGLAAATIVIIARRLVVRLLVAAAFVATLLGALLPHYAEPPRIVIAVNIVSTLGFDLTVAIMVGHATFRPGRVTTGRILGAVILYLYVALIFTGMYRLLNMTIPAAFSGLAPSGRSPFADLLYFSLGSLTTAGSGPIAPVHPFVRSMTSLEAVIGQLYPATLLGRLVTLHASATDRHAPPKRRESE